MRSILCLLIAYLLGSIPSAYLAGKWAMGIDLRQVGSGNLGFTNAWRNLGAKWSIPVLVIDILKGALAIGIARFAGTGSELLPILCGLAAIAGHTCTIFLGFKGGGKGVACSGGVFFALTPLSFLVTLAVFLLTLFWSRFVSLASMVGAVTLVAVGATLRGAHSGYAPSPEVFWFSVIAALLVIVRHSSNIRRLWSGTEAKLGEKNKEVPS